MKITTIVKINPIVEITSPVLLQCRSGECGSCPKDTGKLLWIPATDSGVFKLQYNFFNKNSEGIEDVKYNNVGQNLVINGASPSYHNRPNKAFSDTTNTFEFPTFAPSLMRGTDYIENQFTPEGWLYFKQRNPAIGNVHDALCFEYNHEKRLITFRSF